MARSTNTPALSRRHALAGLAALSAGTMAVVAVRAAGTGSDAELLKLDRELDLVSKSLTETYQRSKLAHDVADANMPPLPEVARVTSADRRLLPRPWSRKEPDFFTLGDLHDLKRCHLAQSTRTDGVVHDGIDRSAEVIAALEDWREQQNAIFEATGYTAIQDEIEELSGLLDDLFERILEIPATTLGGMIVKAKAVKCLYSDEEEIDIGETTDMQLAASICKDLLRLSGAMTA